MNLLRCRRFSPNLSMSSTMALSNSVICLQSQYGIFWLDFSLENLTSVVYISHSGYDIRTVQELLSHKDVKTTMIYTHVLNRGGQGVRVFRSLN